MRISRALAQKRDRANEEIGRSKGGLNTKLHALCDALGNPVAFHLMPGHLHDVHGADALRHKVVGRFGALLADRAYEAQQRIVDVLNAGSVEIVIPSKINRTYQRKHDRQLYGTRPSSKISSPNLKSSWYFNTI